MGDLTTGCDANLRNRNVLSEEYQIAHGCSDPIELDKFSMSTDVATRTKVAGNEYAANETLHRLTHDDMSSVRWIVAENKNAPVSALIVLAKDESFNVRRAVAHNPNTPIELLLELTTDPNFTVVRDAKKTLSERDILSDLLEE